MPARYLCVALVAVFTLFVSGTSNADPQPATHRRVQPAAAPQPAWRALADELWPQTQILRDTYGVAHVKGETDNATFFGFGYAQAEDHWKPMLEFYFAGQGELAARIGDGPSVLPWSPGRITNLLIDVMAQLFELPRRAKENYAAMPPKIRQMCDAFAAGVNVYLAELAAKNARPEWARDVEPTDVMGISQLILLTHTLEAVFDEPFKTPQKGSNQVAVAPRHSTTGHALFHMDTHQGLIGLEQWYEAHIVGPSFDVRGATVIGSPLIVMGFTPKTAWSMTRNRPDMVDVYHEKISPTDPKRYVDAQSKDADGCSAFREYSVAIGVKGANGAVQSIPYHFRATRHGPLFPILPMVNTTAGPGYVYAIRSAYFEAESASVGGMYAQLWAMAAAKNLAEFKAAMALQQLPIWNIMAATADGDIYYIYNARAPKRPAGFDYLRPLPASGAEWTGFYSFAETPQIENPASGWMQNCNVHPDHVTAGDADFTTPKEVAPSAQTERGMRMTALVTAAIAQGKIDPPTFATFGRDTWIRQAAEMVPKLLAAYQAEPADAKPAADSPVAVGMAELARWDFQARADSVAAALWISWYDAQKIETKSAWSPAQLLASFKAHLETFATSFGRGKFATTWGELHGTKRGETWFPSGGVQIIDRMDTIKAALWEGPRKPVRAGSGFMQTVIFGADGVPRAQSVVPFGSSENPQSPHFADQAELWGREQMKPAWLEWREVTMHAESFMSGGMVQLWLDRDTPPLRVFPPDATDDVPAPLVRGTVKRVDVAPLFWRPASEHGVIEIELASAGDVIAPEMQPIERGIPYYAVTEWYGPAWSRANGSTFEFVNGLPRRGWFGLFRPRRLDPFEDF